MTGELWDYRECERETGYSRHSLRMYYRLGKFVEPARVVGTAYLFDPAAVRAWRGRHVANRAPVGLPPPREPRRKRNA